jgi:hypothetical protein
MRLGAVFPQGRFSTVDPDEVVRLVQRQTALVAEQVATLALLAPGRLRLGVGIGWNDVEDAGANAALASTARARACRGWRSTSTRCCAPPTPDPGVSRTG